MNIFKKAISGLFHSKPKESGKKRGYTQAEKEQHYKDIASGKIQPNANSNRSAAEQIAYAKAQVDRRNEERRIYAYNHSTPQEREKFKAANTNKAGKQSKRYNNSANSSASQSGSDFYL